MDRDYTLRLEVMIEALNNIINAIDEKVKMLDGEEAEKINNVKIYFENLLKEVN